MMDSLPKLPRICLLWESLQIQKQSISVIGNQLLPESMSVCKYVGLNGVGLASDLAHKGTPLPTVASCAPKAVCLWRTRHENFMYVTEQERARTHKHAHTHIPSSQRPETSTNRKGAFRQCLVQCSLSPTIQTLLLQLNARGSLFTSPPRSRAPKNGRTNIS